MAIVAGKFDIIHKRGDAYTMVFHIYDQDPDTDLITDFPLTNVKLDMQVRASADSTEVLFTPKLEIHDASHGRFKWRITKSLSESINVGAGVYDIQITFNDTNPDMVDVITFLEGSFNCVNDVTRPLNSYTLQPLSLNGYAYGVQAQSVEVEETKPLSPLDQALNQIK